MIPHLSLKKFKNSRMIILSFFIFIIVVVYLFTALQCNQKDKIVTHNGESTEGYFQFARDPSEQPVVSSGRTGWPIFPSDPAVWKDSEGYHLFYTTYFCSKDGTYYYS
ncbi:MAG: hypothetical protein P8078_09400, partial [bacterium]